MAMKVDYLDELAKDLVKQYKTKDALFGDKGVVKELQKRLLQAALDCRKILEKVNFII